MVKCVKLYLIYQETNGIDYQTLCKTLWGLQQEVRTAKNTAVTVLYEHLLWKEEQKRLTGVYPDDSKHFGCKLGKYVYDIMSPKAPNLQTGNLSTIQQVLTGKFKKTQRELLKGERSLDSFKANQPIELHNKNIRFKMVGKEILADLSLFSTQKRKELGLKNGVLSFKLWKLGPSQEQIVLRCIQGIYKHGAGSLLYDKKKKMWTLSLSYKFDAEPSELNPERICGIDLGIAVPVYCAVSDGYNRMSFPGGKIEEFSKQIEHRRKNLLRSRPFCGDGSKGHGYKKRVQPVEVLSKKIANFRDTQNDLMSHAIIQFAVQNQCGMIQMEDLTGIGERSAFLKRWSYYDLQLKIEQKAAEAGISVKKIKAQYTSQRCSKCGHVAKENRLSQAEFVCVSCGYTANADYNAARNIAIEDIDKMIEKTLRANQERTY